MSCWIECETRGQMDIIEDFAAPMPAIVTAEMLGVPTEDHVRSEKVVGRFRGDAGQFSA